MRKQSGKLLSENRRKSVKFWTTDEDKSLQRAVEEFGEGNWKLISERIKGRTHQQCKQRYNKFLQPGAQKSIKKGKWSKEEDDQLSMLVLCSVGGDKLLLSRKVCANNLSLLLL